MGWCDEVLGLSPGDEITGLVSDEAAARLESLSASDLVRGWRELAHTGLKQQTPGTHAFLLYFDRLSYDTPDRALQFIEAALAEEPDDAVVALLVQGKLLGQLLHFHAPKVAASLQALALRRPRLRWLMGGATWSVRGGMVEDDDAKRRLLSICDEASFSAWREARREGSGPVDFATMPVPDLAKAWIEITARSDLDKERDDNASALFDFQSDLVKNDPHGALELVKAILAIEDNPNVLGLLAAGMLEDLLPAEDGPLVDAVVRRPNAMRASAIFCAVCGCRM